MRESIKGLNHIGSFLGQMVVCLRQCSPTSVEAPLKRARPRAAFFGHDEEEKAMAITNLSPGTEVMPREPQIHDTILVTLGNTPLVRLHRVARGVACDLVAKVEFFNPGGSIKDRIGI